jgi:hypothetical protein
VQRSKGGVRHVVSGTTKGEEGDDKLWFLVLAVYMLGICYRA